VEVYQGVLAAVKLVKPYGLEHHIAPFQMEIDHRLDLGEIGVDPFDLGVFEVVEDHHLAISFTVKVFELSDFVEVGVLQPNGDIRGLLDHEAIAIEHDITHL